MIGSGNLVLRPVRSYVYIWGVLKTQCVFLAVRTQLTYKVVVASRQLDCLSHSD